MQVVTELFFFTKFFRMINYQLMPKRSRTVRKLQKAIHKNPAAVSLGRRGGLKGGPARAKKLTAKQRSESARKAVNARWGNR